MDPGFKDWEKQGIRVVQDLFEGSTIRSFKQLQEKFNLSNNTLFGYLQIRDFLFSIPYYKQGEGPHHLEKLITEIHLQKK